MSALRLQFVIEALDRATAPVKGISRALDRLTEPASRVRAAFGAVRSALGDIVRVAAGVSAIVGAGIVAFKPIADSVDNINDAAAALGMTTQRYQEMGYAAQLSGSSQEEMGQSLLHLNKSMGEARRGSKEALQMFAHVGVTMDDLRKKDAGAIYEQIADKFHAVGDAGQNAGKKVEVATFLLSRTGYRMIQMMNGGSGAMRAMYAEARRLGVVLSDDTVKAMGEFNDSWDRLRLTLFGALATLLAKIAPTLRTIIERFVTWVVASRELISTKVEKFIERIVGALPRMLEGVKQVVGALDWFIDRANSVAAALGGWPNVIALLAGLMSVQLLAAVVGLTTAMTALSAAAWTNPLTWVLAAVTALIVALPLLVMHWDEVIKKLYELRDAMPEWLKNKDDWLVFKLLPNFELKPPSDANGPGDPATGPPPSWTQNGRPRLGPVADGKQVARTGAEKESLDVGGTISIRIDQEGKARVQDIRKATGSPVDIDVYVGRPLAN